MREIMSAYWTAVLYLEFSEQSEKKLCLSSRKELKSRK